MRYFTKRILAAAGIAVFAFSISASFAPNAMADPVFPTMNDSGGIYWRSAPNWNNPIVQSGYGVYPGTYISVHCYQTGTSVPGSANTMWVQAAWASGPGTGHGWINEHFVNDGAPINQAAPGVPPCVAGPPSSGSYINASVAVRYCTNTNLTGCSVLGPTLATNTAVTMACWKDASGHRWFYVTSSSGVVGFVTAGYVSRQATVDGCGAHRAVTAAEQAASRDGQVWASTADRAYFSASEWAPGPVGEWSGDCPKLPYVAWKASGITLVKNNAIDNYHYYANNGQIHSGTPTLGGVAFFNITTYGHEATYIDGQQLANVIAPLSSYGNYLGYFAPA
jgi:hypothetical protein